MIDKKMKVTQYIFCACVCLVASAVGWALSPVRSLLSENRLEDALGMCRQYEVLSTNDRDNLFACAWIYFRTERSDAAERILLQLKSAYATPEYQLLTAYQRMKKKQFDEAKKIINMIKVEHKGTTVSLSAEELYGEMYEMMGQLDTAAFIYNQVVSQDSKRARAHWGLGRHYLARGENGRAIFHLEQAAKMWPKHLGSRFNLGVLYLGQENIREAARWFTECYKLDKGDPAVLEYLGVLFEKKGMIKEAVRYWRLALDIKKDSPLAKEKLGIYFTQVIDEAIEEKRYDKALALIQAAGGSFGDQAKMQLQRGVIYRNLGSYEKAAGELLAYLATHSKEGTALREIGICYVNLKLIDQASDYFARAVTEESENGLNHAWMAFILEGKRDLTRAREEWKRAIELLKDPIELEKATRRLAAIERKLNRR